MSMETAEVFEESVGILGFYPLCALSCGGLKSIPDAWLTGKSSMLVLGRTFPISGAGRSSAEFQFHERARRQKQRHD